MIDSQTPDETIDQILRDSQRRAVDAATAADAVGPTGWDYPLPDPNSPASIAKWLLVGVAVVGAVAFLGIVGVRH